MNQEIKIELTDEVANGTYSNLAVITHSSSEFILDFAILLPGLKKANVKSRVIMTPEHAKRLLVALKENMAKYESMFGKINGDDFGNNGFPMNIGNSSAQA